MTALRTMGAQKDDHAWVLLAAGSVALLVAFLAPLLVVGLVVLAGTRLLARGRWWLWLLMLAVSLDWAAGLPLAAWHTQPEAFARQYLLLQQATGAALLDALLNAVHASGEAWSPWQPAALGYVRAVWPWSIAYGPALGVLSALVLTLTDWLHGGGVRLQRNRMPRPTDAGTEAQRPPRLMAWLVPNVLGRGVVTLLSAPPGLGKGWALWSLMRALQESDTWFGLPVHRQPGQRVLWCTEEGQSFADTARRFGIAPGLVEVLRREQLGTVLDWPALVKAIRRVAWQRRCGLVIIDTVRAWCPEAEKTPEQANAVLLVARHELTKPGLGVLFVHHDRKGGGDFGEGVAGTNALVGAVDILAELRRVPGQPEARRLVTSRRFTPLDVTATLAGVRYVVEALATSRSASPVEIPSRLRPTLEALQGRGAAGLTAAALQAVAGGDKSSVSRRLSALEALGLVTRDGAGTKGSPSLWRPVVAPTNGTALRPPLTAEEYAAYRETGHWQRLRLRALDRAGGVCESCHQAAATDVHHLSYAALGAEPLTDLIAVCVPCHNRLHGRGRGVAAHQLQLEG